MITMNTSPDP